MGFREAQCWTRFWKLLSQFLLAGSLLLIIHGSAARAQTQITPATSNVQEIKPPFGIYWGLSMDRLQKTVEETQAKVVDRRDVNGRKSLVVEGLVSPGLQRAIFYFIDDGLCEVELQYAQPNLDDTAYANYFDNWRRSLERKYGIGQLITRSKKRDGDTLMTIIGYQWVQAACTLRVFYFSAEKGADSYHLVSLHYRGV